MIRSGPRSGPRLGPRSGPCQRQTPHGSSAAACFQSHSGRISPNGVYLLFSHSSSSSSIQDVISAYLGGKKNPLQPLFITVCGSRPHKFVFFFFFLKSGFWSWNAPPTQPWFLSFHFYDCFSLNYCFEQMMSSGSVIYLFSLQSREMRRWEYIHYYTVGSDHLKSH